MFSCGRSSYICRLSLFGVLAGALLLPWPVFACSVPTLSPNNVFIVWDNATQSCSPYGCPVAQTVQFTVATFGVDLSCPLWTYSWDFGDGTHATSSTGTAQHQYASPGLYQVSVAITGPTQVTLTRTLGVVPGVPTLSEAAMILLALSLLVVAVSRLR